MIKFVARLILLSLFFLVSLLFNPHSTFAAESIIFEDYFNSSVLDNSKWVWINDGGSITLNSGYLILSSSSRRFPVVTNKVNIFPDGLDFYVEFKIKWRDITDFGTGIFLGNDVLNYESNLSGVTNQFTVWPNPSGTFVFINLHCSSQYNCSPNYTTIGTFDDALSDHIIRITRYSNNYTVTVDGIQIDNDTLLDSSRIPQYLNIGNVVTLDSSKTWSSLLVDYVKVVSLRPDITPNPTPDPTGTPSPSPTPTTTPTPSPSPSPTPSPTQKRPIIFVPGFGASWNYKAILSDDNSGSWSIPSFVKVYNNLLNSISNADYEINKDLFIFAYDWRKSLDLLSDDLNKYVESLIASGKLKSSDEINLVGHSFGGVVARTYVQKYDDVPVNRVITAGSPHQGLIDAYYAWEGATMKSDVWWMRAALELQTKLNRKDEETKVETLRRISPSLKDLLPTFNYLSLNNKMVPYDAMFQKNEFLYGLNTDSDSVNNRLWVNAGLSHQTDEKIMIGQRSWLDRLNSRWEDGKPISTTTADGDGVVLSTSASHDFTNRVSVDGNHDQIISSEIAVKNILNQLDIDQSSAVVSDDGPVIRNVFVASLRSPGKLHVCKVSICDGDLGIYIENEKLFFLPGDEDNNLTVSIDADGETGDYKLYLGDLKSLVANWEVIEGELESNNQIDRYEVDTSDDQMLVNFERDNIVRILKRDFEVLQSMGIKINIDKFEKLFEKPDYLKYIREKLKEEANKANQRDNSEMSELIIKTWRDLDSYLMSIELSSSKHDRLRFLVGEKVLSTVSVLAEKKLSKSNNYFAGAFFEEYQNRFSLAKSVADKNPRLSVFLLESAKILLEAAVMLK